MAQRYKEKANNPMQLLPRALQQASIEEVSFSCPQIQARLHGAATDPTHMHILVSWRTERSWMSIRSSLKTSLTKRLHIESHMP